MINWLSSEKGRFFVIIIFTNYTSFQKRYTKLPDIPYFQRPKPCKMSERFTSEKLYLWQHKPKLRWTKNQKLELLVHSICYCFTLLFFHLICVPRFASALLKGCVLILFWPPIQLNNSRNLCQYNMLILWGCATFVSVPVYLP